MQHGTQHADELSQQQLALANISSNNKENPSQLPLAMHTIATHAADETATVTVVGLHQQGRLSHAAPA
jgi:hypothetical protein